MLENIKNTTPEQWVRGAIFVFVAVLFGFWNGGMLITYPGFGMPAFFVLVILGGVLFIKTENDDSMILVTDLSLAIVTGAYAGLFAFVYLTAPYISKM